MLLPKITNGISCSCRNSAPVALIYTAMVGGYDKYCVVEYAGIFCDLGDTGHVVIKFGPGCVVFGSVGAILVPDMVGVVENGGYELRLFRANVVGSQIVCEKRLA